MGQPFYFLGVPPTTLETPGIDNSRRKARQTAAFPGEISKRGRKKFSVWNHVLDPFPLRASLNAAITREVGRRQGVESGVDRRASPGIFSESDTLSCFVNRTLLMV